MVSAAQLDSMLIVSLATAIAADVDSNAADAVIVAPIAAAASPLDRSCRHVNWTDMLATVAPHTVEAASE